MLQSLTTLLARERRQKRSVPFFAVSVPEAMYAVAEAAESTGRPCVISIDLTGDSGSCLPPGQLVANALYVAARTTVALSVQVVMRPNKELARQALSWGVSAIGLVFSAGTPTHERQAARQICERAHAAGTMVIGRFEALRPPGDLASIAKETGISAVSLPLVTVSEGRPALSADYLHDLEKSVGVPIFAQHVPTRRFVLKKAFPLGIAGFSVEDEFDHAYTAGLRTALRDRTLHRPAQYEKRAVVAVRQAALHYLQHSN